MRFCRASQEEEEKERAEWQWETDPGFVVVFAVKHPTVPNSISVQSLSTNNPII